MADVNGELGGESYRLGTRTLIGVLHMQIFHRCERELKSAEACTLRRKQLKELLTLA